MIVAVILQLGWDLCRASISTGGRTILGRITKRGSRYLRMLFVQAAQVIMMRPKELAKVQFWRMVGIRLNAHAAQQARRGIGQQARPDRMERSELRQRL